LKTAPGEIRSSPSTRMSSTTKDSAASAAPATIINSKWKQRAGTARKFISWIVLFFYVTSDHSMRRMSL
jgi:hypothetical protein